jgi:hypothetical protein
MQSRKPILPPSRAVLVLLPLTLIEALDYAANVLNLHRTDVIRRSLIRDVNSALREEVSRTQAMSGLERITDLGQTLRDVAEGPEAVVPTECLRWIIPPRQQSEDAP